MSESSGTCRLDGCDKPVKRTGLCYGHYMRQWRYGDPLYEFPPTWRDIIGRRFGQLVVISRLRNGWVCQCDCGAETFVRAGDLNRGSVTTCGDRAQHRRQEHINYSAAHMRVRQDRGSVRAHPCVDCGQPARHWSYNHDDPDELLGTTGRSPRLVAYSPKPEHYSPRCVPCHKRFDLDRVDAA